MTLLPHAPEGWANLGSLTRMAGDTERARNFLETALKQDPDSVETRTEFGILEAGLDPCPRHFELGAGIDHVDDERDRRHPRPYAPAERVCGQRRGARAA